MSSIGDGDIRSEGGGEKSEIPQFDLAEEIMAEQRKISALNRKGPVRLPGLLAETKEMREMDESTKTEEAATDLAASLRAVKTGEDRMIAEIVGRDIERVLVGR